MPRPYVRLRETTFDLYVERDLLPGYYKATSTLASWVILAGYALFAVTFTSRDEDLSAGRNLITGIAAALLVVGYLAAVIVAIVSRSLLFLIEGVMYPSLTASATGLFITIINYVLHTQQSTAPVYMTVPLVASCITTVVSALVLGFAYRELSKIRHRDERRRWHVQLGPYVGNHPDPNAMLDVAGLDDEAQRRQLMRLLHDRQESITNLDEHNNTFKIDLPGETAYEPKRNSDSEHRGTSPDRGGFSLGSLMPWRNAKQGTFKDARERRREEIERSSIPNLQEAWMASAPNQTTQPPSWGPPPATRYA